MAAPCNYLRTDEEFRQAVAESLLVRQVPGRIGLAAISKIVQSRSAQPELDTSHFTGAACNQAAAKQSDEKLLWKK